MKQKQDIYAYPPIEQWKWHNCDGTQQVNVDEFIAKHIDEDFFVGTDSHVYGKSVKFSTALVAWNRGHGACVLYYHQKTLSGQSLRQRLLAETFRSLVVAYYLDARIPQGSVINVHIDVNPSLKYESGSCREQLIGMIVAQGVRFRPACKPDAWAAMSVADYTT